MAKKWSDSELDQLKRLAGSKQIEELSRMFKAAITEITEKLSEFGLVAAARPNVEKDAALPAFNDALKSLYAQDWSAGAKGFEAVIEKSDSSQLVDRARQYLTICQDRLAKPQTDDPYLQAVYEKNRGELDTALTICMESGKPSEDERYAYLLASIQALSGDEEKALKTLETAIRLEPKNRVHAYHDPDFAALHGQEQFTQLIAARASSAT